MKRFVSYLYSVYNNQKIHNAGFARIELRTGRNRIDIHLQENGYAGKNGTVYLFVRNQENIHGIPIGNIIFRNNQADFRYEQPEENIGQTSWQIMQMSGIVIQIEDRIAFLSQWDEKPIDTDRFEVWSSGQADSASSEETVLQKEEGTASQSGQTNSNASNEPQLSQAGGSTSKESQSGQARSAAANELQADQMKEEANNNIESNQSQPPDMAANIQPKQADCNDNTCEKQANTDFSAMPDAQTQASTIHTAEIQPQPQLNRSSWEQTWRYMLRMYPVLNQFAEEDNVLCVRIEIKDVRLLPEKYWSMVNNSFLLHGFFNYRYLVFGRIGQNWFIGIPGIYQNQEHVMASIFGFPDFLSQAQKNERGEQPGYWYRVLKI